jgi:hypothetical protein
MLRQEDPEFNASLDYIMRHGLKKLIFPPETLKNLQENQRVLELYLHGRALA